jgi:hypothetical protein
MLEFTDDPPIGYCAITSGRQMPTLETLATAWVKFAAASHFFPNLGLKALRR